MQTKCDTCNGTGKMRCNTCRSGTCELCDGHGTINRGVYSPGGSDGGKVTCSKCSGTGKCPYCGGTGRETCHGCGGKGYYAD